MREIFKFQLQIVFLTVLFGTSGCSVQCQRINKPQVFSVSPQTPLSSLDDASRLVASFDGRYTVIQKKHEIQIWDNVDEQIVSVAKLPNACIGNRQATLSQILFIPHYNGFFILCDQQSVVWVNSSDLKKLFFTRLVLTSQVEHLVGIGFDSKRQKLFAAESSGYILGWNLEIIDNLLKETSNQNKSVDVPLPSEHQYISHSIQQASFSITGQFAAFIGQKESQNRLIVLRLEQREIIFSNPLGSRVIVQMGWGNNYNGDYLLIDSLLKDKKDLLIAEYRFENNSLDIHSLNVNGVTGGCTKFDGAMGIVSSIQQDTLFVTSLPKMSSISMQLPGRVSNCDYVFLPQKSAYIYRSDNKFVQNKIPDTLLMNIKENRLPPYAWLEHQAEQQNYKFSLKRPLAAGRENLSNNSNQVVATFPNEQIIYKPSEGIWAHSDIPQEALVIVLKNKKKIELPLDTSPETGFKAACNLQGTLLAVSDRKKGIVLFKREKLSWKVNLDFPSFPSKISGAVFSPDSKFIYVVGRAFKRAELIIQEIWEINLSNSQNVKTYEVEVTMDDFSPLSYVVPMVTGPIRNLFLVRKNGWGDVIDLKTGRKRDVLLDARFSNVLTASMGQKRTVIWGQAIDGTIIQMFIELEQRTSAIQVDITDDILEPKLHWFHKDIDVVLYENGQLVVYRNKKVLHTIHIQNPSEIISIESAKKAISNGQKIVLVRADGKKQFVDFNKGHGFKWIK